MRTGPINPMEGHQINPLPAKKRKGQTPIEGVAIKTLRRSPNPTRAFKASSKSPSPQADRRMDRAFNRALKRS